MESATTALIVLKQAREKGPGSHVFDVLSFLFLHPFAALGLPSLMALNELGQVVRLLRHANKLVLEQFASRWALEVSRLSAVK